MGAGLNANSGWIYEHGVLVRARRVGVDGRLVAPDHRDRSSTTGSSTSA